MNTGEEPKPCPFCGFSANRIPGGANCSCIRDMLAMPLDEWNTRPIEDALNARIKELEAQVRYWLEEIASTPPEELWQMDDRRMRYVEIQVGKKDYLEARKQLKELQAIEEQKKEPKEPTKK